MYRPSKFPNNDFILTRCASVRDVRVRMTGAEAPASAYSGEDVAYSALPSSKLEQYDAALRDYENRLRDEDEQRRANAASD